MATHSTLITRRVRSLIERFISTRFAQVRAGDLLSLPHLHDLDSPFLDHWKRLKEEHADCEACQGQKECITGDALRALTPDPVTGVSTLLHDHILTRGNFDTAGHGFMLMPAAPPN